MKYKKKKKIFLTRSEFNTKLKWTFTRIQTTSTTANSTEIYENQNKGEDLT